MKTYNLGLLAEIEADKAEGDALVAAINNDIAMGIAHAEALEENDMFDGILCDGLTPEQRKIESRRMGFDIYGDGLQVAHAEALKMNKSFNDGQPGVDGKTNDQLTEQREFDIVQRADGIQYACINEQAVFFRAHRSGTWVRTSVKPELEYFTPAGTERITDVDTSAPIFTGHNLAEISAYFKG